MRAVFGGNRTETIPSPWAVAHPPLDDATPIIPLKRRMRFRDGIMKVEPASKALYEETYD